MCSQKCSEIIVAHLGYLNYTQYNIFVSFEDLKLTYTIQNITFTVSIKVYSSKRRLFNAVEVCFNCNKKYQIFEHKFKKCIIIIFSVTTNVRAVTAFTVDKRV